MTIGSITLGIASLEWPQRRTFRRLPLASFRFDHVPGPGCSAYLAAEPSSTIPPAAGEANTVVVL